MHKVSLQDGKSILVDSDGALSYAVGQFANGNPFKILYATESGEIENIWSDTEFSCLFVGNAQTNPGDSVTHTLLNGNKIRISFNRDTPESVGYYETLILDPSDEVLYRGTYSSGRPEDLQPQEYYAFGLVYWVTEDGLAGDIRCFRKYTRSAYKYLNEIDKPPEIGGQISGNNGNTMVTLKKKKVFTFDETPSELKYLIPTYIMSDEDDSTDPYAHGGTSSIGGGGGTYTMPDSPFDFAPLPALSAVDVGFLTLYKPTKTQMVALAQYMWSDFPEDIFKKIMFGDPMKCILGASIIPVDLPIGVARNIKVGNVDSGIFCNVVSGQYVKQYCGSIAIPRYFNAYLDYDPYTKLQIFLPFIGTRSLSADEFIGKNMSIEYTIDVISGGCLAQIKANDKVLYNFSGQCASSIPVTGTDWTNVLNGIINSATNVASLAVGGASATGVVSAIGNIASTVANQSKPDIIKSGSLSGSIALLGNRTPALISIRPSQAPAPNQNKFIGYPSYIEKRLGTMTGYYEVREVHLQNMTGTLSEVEEIEKLLKGGVIA